MKRVFLLVAVICLALAGTASANEGHKKVKVCLDGKTVLLTKDQAAGAVKYHHAYLGECKVVVVPPLVPPVVTLTRQIDRDGACASHPVLRVGDNTYGIFVDLDQATFDAGTFAGVTFTAALFVQGLGETCDVPAGFKYTGYNVESSGKVNTDAPQFNIHPYYVKA